MGLRFQKRIKIFNGLTLNISKTGISWTLGQPGAGINIRGGKVTGNVGIPGTGISYRQRLDRQSGVLVKILPWLIALLVLGHLFWPEITAFLGTKPG